ncbi:MAG: DUF4426 domain-containing protein [Pseudomonadales bacterium]
MNRLKILHPALTVILAFVLAGSASAEQKQRLGVWDVHYVVIPTLFLKPDIAASYDVVRGVDRAMMNISVLDSDGVPVHAALTGSMTNLLGQVQALSFREVTEGEAVYYLAEVKHTDRETLRFRVEIVPPDGTAQVLAFQQQMFWEGR